MALGGLLRVGDAGLQILNRFDLLEGALEGVYAIFNTRFATTGGLRVRSEYGDNPVYGVLTRSEPIALRSDGRPHNHWTRLESHIPVEQDTSLRLAAMEANNSTDFLHIATIYRDGVATFTLHYRRAHPDDLGTENNGDYHHARAVPVIHNTTTDRDGGVDARAEVNDGGVVMDYLWKNGNGELWADTFAWAGADRFDQAAASTTAHFMQDQKAEVSCADVIVSYDSANEQGWEGPEDVGIVAFGWNNQPFGFNGRSGGWLNDCSNPLG